MLMLGRLVERIRRTLATKYLEDGLAGMQIKGMEVKGAIEAEMSDESDLFGQRLPMLVIVGRDVSWKEFGQLHGNVFVPRASHRTGTQWAIAQRALKTAHTMSQIHTLRNFHVRRQAKNRFTR